MAERTETMSRGLLTDAEKQAIRGEIADENRASTYISRAKSRLQNELAEDARFLREHRVDLYDIMHESVCELEIDERVDELETQVQNTRAVVEMAADLPIDCGFCDETLETYDEVWEHADKHGVT